MSDNCSSDQILVAALWSKPPSLEMYTHSSFFSFSVIIVVDI